MTRAQASEIQVTPLRRNWRFQILWFGAASSSLGISTADIGYPLLILAVTGSPAYAGLFGAAHIVGSLIAGLPAGSIADRFNSRAVLVICEGFRMALSSVVVATLIWGTPAPALLLSVGLLMGAGEAMVRPVRLLLLRDVVPPAQLTAALTQDEVRANAATLIGPAIGGALYAIHNMNHATLFVFVACTYLIATIAASLVAPSNHLEKPNLVNGKESGGALAGISWLWAQPMLRAAVLLVTAISTSTAGLQLVVIVVLQDQDISAGLIGVALAVGESGALVGTLLIRAAMRVRPGVFLGITCLMQLPLFLLFSLHLGPWWVAALLFVGTLSIPCVRVVLDILVIRQAPPQQRGRVIAALLLIMSLGAPIGLAGTGLLLQTSSALTTLAVLTVVLILGSLYSLTRTAFWRQKWPEEVMD